MMTTEQLEQVKTQLAHKIDRMPKDTMQKLTLLNKWLTKAEQELLAIGLDYPSLVGTIEILKFKIQISLQQSSLIGSQIFMEDQSKEAKKQANLIK